MIFGKFLNDVFTNENNYPYLIKEFDSLESLYHTHKQRGLLERKQNEKNTNNNNNDHITFCC